MNVTAWPDNPPPLVLTGPTATGKTALAVELAQRWGGEIVNADSMQVYRFMEIGTAKPSAEERALARFHLLDLVRPDEAFNVADWKRLAEEAIADIHRRGKRPLLCGGTGMYLRALLDDWGLAETPPASDIRNALEAELTAQGAPALHRRLAEVDPPTAKRLHPNDGVRIVRALEVYQRTGEPISVHQARDRERAQSRPALCIGLTLPRPALYERIEQRVDAMIEAGLEREVRELLERGFSPELHPLQSLGYKEMTDYLNGKHDLITAITLIKQNTRRFAKRQQTWFRPDTRIQWVDMSELTSATAADRIQGLFGDA